jgi:hypothetical protein
VVAIAIAASGKPDKGSSAISVINPDILLHTKIPIFNNSL